MGNLNKVTYTDHQTVITAANLNDIQDSVIANTSYSTCTTAANTAAKTAALTNFVLTTGSCILVKFTYSNTAASPTLNVNGTGAKAIKKYGTTAAGTTVADSWEAGAVVEFVYDGTNWIMEDNKSDSFVPKTGGTVTGDVTIDKNRTGTNLGISVLTLGNDIPNGTAGNSYGVVRLYGKTNQYTNLSAGDSTATRGIALPDASGTIMLKETPILNSSHDLDDLRNSSDNGFYGITTGVLNAPASYCNLLVMAGSQGCSQIVFDRGAIYTRMYKGNPATWSSWYKYTGTVVS